MSETPTPTDILVVEDDGLLRRMAVEMLTDEGFAAEGVSGGEEALTYLRSSPDIRLLITDINMPGMSGLELARSVREQFKSVGLLVVSGGAALNSQSLPPAAEFLQKPFTVPHFLARVRGMLSGGIESAVP